MAATGVDYRAAHGVVGGLVRALEENGRSLAEATVGDLCDALREAGLPSDGRHASNCSPRPSIRLLASPRGQMSAARRRKRWRPWRKR